MTLQEEDVWFKITFDCKYLRKRRYFETDKNVGETADNLGE